MIFVLTSDPSADSWCVLTCMRDLCKCQAKQRQKATGQANKEKISSSFRLRLTAPIQPAHRPNKITRTHTYLHIYTMSSDGHETVRAPVKSLQPNSTPIKVLAPLNSNHNTNNNQTTTTSSAASATNPSSTSSDSSSHSSSSTSSSPSASSSSSSSSSSFPISVPPLATDEPDLVAIAKNEHLLHQRWTFWYGLKDAKSTAQNWGMSLKKLMEFQSIEQFFGLYNNIARPSALPIGSDYHLFKYGVKPEWEDPENRDGGQWVFELVRSIQSIVTITSIRIEEDIGSASVILFIALTLSLLAL